jgi:hypothetical protein
MRRKQPKPAQAAPKQAMRTVGVKIPVAVWDKLNRFVIAEQNAHPARKYTVSDAIREKLSISLNES